VPGEIELQEHDSAHGASAEAHESHGAAADATEGHAAASDAHGGGGSILAEPHHTFLNAYPIVLEALAGTNYDVQGFGARYEVAAERVGTHQMSPVPGTITQWVGVNALGSWFVIGAIVLLMHVGVRRMQAVPGKLQGILEWTFQTFDGFSRNMIGQEKGSQFAPLLATFFIYIFVLNLGGLVPGFISPTAGLNITIALALCCFLSVQYFGFRAQGLKYLMHFVGEPLWMAPINIPIHVLGEFARPLSLSIRLFGNIFGEDTVIMRLIGMGVIALGFAGPTVFGIELNFLAIPVQFPMLLFGIFGAFVQALVFTMLSASYIASVVDVHH
jgi:F-type H+-transporting ATPase subunit a